MDTTQQRHTPSSIAEQELFFPSSKQPSSQQQAQGQHEYDQQTHSSNRWYDDLNNESPTVPSGSGVPAVNIIPATPTTYRSNSVRSQWSYKDPNRTKHAADAVREEEEDEEDNIYDPPSKPRVDIYDPPADSNTADDIYDPPSHRSPSPPSPIESKVAFDEMASSSQQPHHQPAQDNYYVSPMSEPAVLHHDTGYSQPPNGHPTAEDKGKAPEPVIHHNDTGYTYSVPDGHRIPDDKGKSPEPPAPAPVPAPEDRPPLPGPRPSQEPEVADYYAQAHASDPSIQEQEDRDYAMALALQEEEEGNQNRPALPQRPSQGSSGWGSSGPPVQQPSHPMSPEDEDRALAMRLQHEEEHGGPAPPLPARPHPDAVAAMLKQQQEPAPFTRTPSTEGFFAPPKRQGSDFGADDPNNPVHYSRDPHKLIAYLVPFPKPWLGARGPPPADKNGMPTRFLVYTPPPPPLQAPPEGVKEGVTHKVQRKWQTEVRQAKQSDAKTTSWAGFKAKCTRGVDKAMQYTTTSNLDFLARVTPPPAPASSSSTSNLARKLSLKGKGRRNKSKEGKDGDAKGKDSVDVDEKAEESGKPADGATKAADEKAKEAGVYDKAREAGSEEKAREENPFEEKFSEEKARDEKVGGKSSDDVKEEEGVQDDDPAHGSHETKKTVGVEEIVFVYPPSMNMTPEQMREEFVNTMLRTKSKAQRDAIIATGLLPVSLAIDLVMIAISGLFEVNAVWAYFTIKGTKTARSVTKRIASTSQDPETIDPEKSEKELEKENKLRITFKPAHRIDVLSSYLYAECHRVDSRLFPQYSHAPTEAECLEAIGWSPSRTGGQKNWEDEAWEVNDVKDDLKVVMHKGAKEWRKWCNRYEKDPEKSLKK